MEDDNFEVIFKLIEIMELGSNSGQCQNLRTSKARLLAAAANNSRYPGLMILLICMVADTRIQPETLLFLYLITNYPPYYNLISSYKLVENNLF